MEEQVTRVRRGDIRERAERIPTLLEGAILSGRAASMTAGDGRAAGAGAVDTTVIAAGAPGRGTTDNRAASTADHPATSPAESSAASMAANVVAARRGDDDEQRELNLALWATREAALITAVGTEGGVVADTASGAGAAITAGTTAGTATSVAAAAGAGTTTGMAAGRAAITNRAYLESIDRPGWVVYVASIAGGVCTLRTLLVGSASKKSKNQFFMKLLGEVERSFRKAPPERAARYRQHHNLLDYYSGKLSIVDYRLSSGFREQQEFNNDMGATGEAGRAASRAAGDGTATSAGAVTARTIAGTTAGTATGAAAAAGADTAAGVAAGTMVGGVPSAEASAGDYGSEGDNNSEGDNESIMGENNAAVTAAGAGAGTIDSLATSTATDDDATSTDAGAGNNKSDGLRNRTAGTRANTAASSAADAGAGVSESTAADTGASTPTSPAARPAKSWAASSAERKPARIHQMKITSSYYPRGLTVSPAAQGGVGAVELVADTADADAGVKDYRRDEKRPESNTSSSSYAGAATANNPVASTVDNLVASTTTGTPASAAMASGAGSDHSNVTSSACTCQPPELPEQVTGLWWERDGNKELAFPLEFVFRDEEMLKECSSKHHKYLYNMTPLKGDEMRKAKKQSLFPNLKAGEHREGKPTQPDGIRSKVFNKLKQNKWSNQIEYTWRGFFLSDEFGNVVSEHAKQFSLCHFEVDHIFPWSRGGLSEPENFQALFMGANRVKKDNIINCLSAEKITNMRCGLTVKSLNEILAKGAQLQGAKSVKFTHLIKQRLCEQPITESFGVAWQVLKPMLKWEGAGEQLWKMLREKVEAQAKEAPAQQTLMNEID